MQVDLLYGRTGVTVQLPPHAQPILIEKPVMPVLDHPTQAVAAALEGAFASVPPLERLHDGPRRTACILICDVTRPVPNGLFLRSLVERLIATGLRTEDIVILVATGLHRPNVGAELAEVVGDDWVLRHVTIENHDARSDADHVDLGRTARGTVVRIDRRFVEADIRIATGLVEPHFMAGFSGGRKVIAPGIAHAETITTLHNHQFMSDPQARGCVLDGNPLHEELVEIASMFGGALALNTVIDRERRLAFVNFGEILASHAEAVGYVRRYVEVPVKHRFQTVLTSAAGYPLDKTYYQTVKGIVSAMGILEEGGDLIIVSECSEGLGSTDFAAAQRRYLGAGHTAFVASLAGQAHAAIDEWQTQLLVEPNARANITLFSSGLDQDERSLTGVEVADDIESVIAASLARHGDRRIAVIPEGPYVVPFVR